VKGPEKNRNFRKFAWRSRIFYPDLRPPQISNQIDAAGHP